MIIEFALSTTVSKAFIKECLLELEFTIDWAILVKIDSNLNMIFMNVIDEHATKLVLQYGILSQGNWSENDPLFHKLNIMLNDRLYTMSSTESGDSAGIIVKGSIGSGYSKIVNFREKHYKQENILGSCKLPYYLRTGNFSHGVKLSTGAFR